MADTGIHFQTIDPCALYSTYLNEHHAASVVGHALEWLLNERMNTCPNRADIVEFSAVDPATNGQSSDTLEPFVRSLVSLIKAAWSSFITETPHAHQ